MVGLLIQFQIGNVAPPPYSQRTRIRAGHPSCWLGNGRNGWASPRKSMNRLGRGGRVPARSMKRNGLRAKSWEQRSCGVVEGEEAAWHVDPEGRDNLQAPRLTRYIATVQYIYKQSQGNNKENAGAVPKWELVNLNLSSDEGLGIVVLVAPAPCKSARSGAPSEKNSSPLCTFCEGPGPKLRPKDIGSSGTGIFEARVPVNENRPNDRGIPGHGDGLAKVVAGKTVPRNQLRLEF